MSVLNFKISFAGENEEIVPRLGRLYSSDTLATVSSAGYLNNYIQSSGFSILPTDVIFAVCSNGTQIYKPVFTAGSCQLTVLP